MIAALKLFTGSAEQAPPPQLFTLRECFNAYALPRLQRQGKSPASIAKWWTAIAHWERIYLDNPPIVRIDKEALTAFPDRLLQRHSRIKTNTAANQQLMYVQAILGAAGEVLPKVPHGEPLPSQAATRVRRRIPLDTLSLMYTQGAASLAGKATGDKRLPAALLWRAILVTLYNCPARRSELLAPHIGPNVVVREADFPDQVGLDIAASSPHGWLVFHTPKTERRKGGRPLVLPLNQTVRRHLDELDRLAPQRSSLFPVGQHATLWRKRLLALQQGAGINEPYTFQDFRKTANRAYRQAAGRDVAKYMLGHQPRGVNEQFYDDLTEEAVTAVHKVEQPASFVAGLF